MVRMRARMERALVAWREEFSCAAPRCQTPRRHWKRFSAPIARLRIHGANYCYPVCFERELTRRFRALVGASVDRGGREHRIPLGLLMLSRGEIDGAQLRTALIAQRQSGNRLIGEWIERLGFATEEHVTAAIGAQWACPVLSRIPAESSDCGLPVALLRQFRMAPVSYVAATRVMHIAFAERVDYAALLAIEQALACRTEACIVRSSALNSLLAAAENKPCRSDQVFDHTDTPTEMTRITSSYASLLGATDVRSVRCGDVVWARVEAQESPVNLLFRITTGTGL